MIKSLKASMNVPSYFSIRLYLLSANAIYENDFSTTNSQCEELGYEEKDIIIDSLLSGSPYLEYLNTARENTWCTRVNVEVLRSSARHFSCQNSHSNVIFQYLIGPDFDMPI